MGAAKKTASIALITVLGMGPAFCESATLSPLTQTSLVQQLNTAIVAAKIGNKVELSNCAPKDSDRGPVCTYRVNGLIQLVSETSKDSSNLVGFALRCVIAATVLEGAREDIANCLIAAQAAAGFADPSRPKDDRDKIIETVFGAIAVANSVTVTTDERRYRVLRSRGVGLVFEVYGADGH